MAATREELSMLMRKLTLAALATTGALAILAGTARAR